MNHPPPQELVHVPTETHLAVDLDHGRPVAMSLTERLVAIDIDKVQRESVPLALTLEKRDCLVAKRAASPSVDDDASVRERSPAPESPPAGPHGRAPRL